MKEERERGFYDLAEEHNSKLLINQVEKRKFFPLHHVGVERELRPIFSDFHQTFQFLGHVVTLIPQLFQGIITTRNQGRLVRFLFQTTADTVGRGQEFCLVRPKSQSFKV